MASQSSPNWSYGYVPTAAEWNYWFSLKQDALGYTAVNKAGDTMLGYFVTLAPTAATAGFNLPEGTTPAAPNNGDLWTTSSGIYVQLAGTTYNLTGLPDIATDYMMANLVGSAAQPTGVSWSAFANAAISSTPNTLPINISGSWGTITLGTSVTNPGTGTFETLLPVQTVATASHTFVGADLFKETRRSNSGSSMTDTFPTGTTAGMANGTRIQLNNVDATASDTITAGAGTTFTVSGSTSSTAVVGPGRATLWIYDAPNTTWRPTLNSLSSLLAANNLSEVTNPATALSNIGGVNSAYVLSVLALRGYIGGLTLSNDGTSPNTVMDISAGEATSDDNSTLMQLATAYTKSTSSWTVGTGNGALDTGTIGANNWYHVYLIENTSTPVADILFSLSASSPTMPSGYTKKRRIGSFKTNGSSQILAFTQVGDEFHWSVPVNDVTISLGTTASTLSLNVPTGVIVNALLDVQFSAATNGYALLSPLDITDEVPNSITGYATAFATTSAVIFGTYNIRTNASGQIRGRSTTASMGTNTATWGWIDTRGKFN
jgi:hypothetical protein